MTIATVDDIVSGLAASQKIRFLKILSSPDSAGAFVSAWTAAGRPGAGAVPPAYTAGSGYTCDKSTVGAMPLANAAIKNYLAKLSASSSLPGMLIIADRLWSCSGMGFASGTYAVTTPGALPARITDGGVGVEAYVEQYSAGGVASGTLTLNYLNESGAAKSGQIAAVVSGPNYAMMQPIPTDVGDLGISQVTSIVTSATWTSGSFGVTLLKRIAEFPLSQAGAGGVFDWAQCGLEDVPNDACLMLLWAANSTTAPTLVGSIDLIDK